MQPFYQSKVTINDDDLFESFVGPQFTDIQWNPSNYKINRKAIHLLGPETPVSTSFTATPTLDTTHQVMTAFTVWDGVYTYTMMIIYS